jgi:hypothetical protein
MIMNTYKEVVVAELIVFVLYYMIMIYMNDMMKMELGVSLD